MSASFHFDLTGRTALVTGASSGLGARFGRILAAAGANVVLAARRRERLDALVREIESAGGRAMAVAMDVADEASTIAAYDAAEAAFGPVNTIIANAGVNSEGALLNLPVEKFDQVLAVNIRGVFLTVREGARRLITQERTEQAGGAQAKAQGRVVILSSITATSVSPGLAAYSASKAAVLQMGRVMARDWVRRNINVNMILPGYICTDLNADWFETEAGARQINGFPRKRLMDQSELDVMLLYLSSEASAGVTGAAFTLDDGQSL